MNLMKMLGGTLSSNQLAACQYHTVCLYIGVETEVVMIVLSLIQDRILA